MAECERCDRVGEHSREPRGVEHAFIEIEVPAAPLLSEQEALELAGEPRDDRRQLSCLGIEGGAQLVERHDIREIAGVSDLVMEGGEDAIVPVRVIGVISVDAAQPLPLGRLLLRAVGALRFGRGGFGERLLRFDPRLLLVCDLSRFLHLGRWQVVGLRCGGWAARGSVGALRTTLGTRLRWWRVEFVAEPERAQDELLLTREGVLVGGAREEHGQGLRQPLLEERPPARVQGGRFFRYWHAAQIGAHQKRERLGHRCRTVCRTAQRTTALQFIPQCSIDIDGDPGEVARPDRQAARIFQSIVQVARAHPCRPMAGVDRRVVESPTQRKTVGLTAGQGEGCRGQRFGRGGQQHLGALESRSRGAEDHLKPRIGREGSGGGRERTLERVRRRGLGAGRRRHRTLICGAVSGRSTPKARW